MNAAPMLVGFLAVLGLSTALVIREPTPGALAAPHADLQGTIKSCSVCHAEGGLDAGCLACHHGIAEQVSSKRGFHAERASDCAGCHPDHHGEDFDTMEAIAWRPASRAAFRHDHVEFKLTGSHDELGCRRCHSEGRTYRGLEQECASCHEDVHGSGLFRNCAQCHDQQKFVPASAFDHARTFPLLGRHAEAACDRCHGSLDYKEVKGRECRSCHESPHRFGSPKGCEECHAGADASWQVAQRKFDVPRHAETGFLLSAAHAAVACEKCHEASLPYAERFREPARVAETCTACHEDVHRGQFQAGCTDCHDETRFAPARYGRERHTTFALNGAHEKTECRACHTEVDGVRRFVGSPRECAGCHEDIHRGQFKAACTECHDETRFVPARYDRARHTTFALNGAHERTECRACHTEVEGARRFVDTPRECAACHEDPHAGQFQDSCDRCHDQRAFLPARYPLERHRAFPLDGAHGAVACNSCHTLKAGTRRFLGTPKECATCHADPHGGQFAREMKRDGCKACHGSDSFRMPSFDHAARARYELEGAHAKARCSQCHVEAGKPPVRRYRETPRSCTSCHADEHRGQFANRGCETCHAGFRAWEIRRFDHARTKFPLDGRHARVSCDACHPRVRQRDGAEVVQYRPFGRQCKDCHEVERR